jgi:hypothetical protein
VPITTLSPSLADKLRSEATSVFVCAAFLGLLSIALAAAWYIGVSALKDDAQPPGMHPAEGYVTRIEQVHFSKEYTYIHLGIKTGNHTETWFYREELHRFAPALRSLRIGDFVRASTVPESHGKATSQVIELRRSDDALLTLDQARAYRSDEATSSGIAALCCGAFAVILGFIARALRLRAENPLPDSQTIAHWFAHLSWPIYGGGLLSLIAVSAYFLYRAGDVKLMWVLGPGIMLLGMGVRRGALRQGYLDDNCCLHCGTPLSNRPALVFRCGRSGESCGYCPTCAPGAQRTEYLIGGTLAFCVGTLLLMAAYPVGTIATILVLIFDLTVLPAIVRWMFRGKMR